MTGNSFLRRMQFIHASAECYTTPFFITDHAGKFVYCNDAFRKLTEYKMSELEEMNLGELFEPPIIGDRRGAKVKELGNIGKALLTTRNKKEIVVRIDKIFGFEVDYGGPKEHAMSGQVTVN